MPIEEKDNLEESLTGYKEKVVPITKTTLTWNKELIFVGTTSRGMRSNSMPKLNGDASPQRRCF